MTDTTASSSPDRPVKKSGKGAAGAKSGKPGFFSRIALFVRQIIGELRKVVTPTRKELVNYTIVVLVFVIIMIGITFALDYIFFSGVSWVFGGGGPVDK
ncbi:preprotein translocase subunit SecE [Psychromicrobium lacuslunae]|uniref:Protein translocase subunit SecE n=1 Tax=Psychromicrobium lacuslunae TaxID=1618207 RepID=A0A0D4C029_9MICC|nr:preprotein translocase subunit SecE [Psychromicrobium lacuslunae]AJT41760.1 preprotein translocase subunit SecE [Psychromicrobium lacuslunae]